VVTAGLARCRNASALTSAWLESFRVFYRKRPLSFFLGIIHLIKQISLKSVSIGLSSDVNFVEIDSINFTQEREKDEPLIFSLIGLSNVDGASLPRLQA
jgi:hypothetical protein